MISHSLSNLVNVHDIGNICGSMPDRAKVMTYAPHSRSKTNPDTCNQLYKKPQRNRKCTTIESIQTKNCE